MNQDLNPIYQVQSSLDPAHLASETDPPGKEELIAARMSPIMELFGVTSRLSHEASGNGAADVSLLSTGGRSDGLLLPDLNLPPPAEPESLLRTSINPAAPQAFASAAYQRQFATSQITSPGQFVSDESRQAALKLHEKESGLERARLPAAASSSAHADIQRGHARELASAQKSNRGRKPLPVEEGPASEAIAAQRAFFAAKRHAEYRRQQIKADSSLTAEQQASLYEAYTPLVREARRQARLHPANVQAQKQRNAIYEANRKLRDATRQQIETVGQSREPSLQDVESPSGRSPQAKERNV